MAAFAAGLSFLALLQTIVLHRLELSWRISIIDSVVTAVLLGIGLFILFIIYKYYRPGRSNRVYLIIFGVVITIKFCFLFKWTMAFILSGESAYLVFLDKSMPIRFEFVLLITSLVTLLIWLMGNLSERSETEKRHADSEQLLKEAELSGLRQQLQPHFLFNSLNSITALVATKPAEARKMIQQLSDFLRGTLKKDDKQLVKLSEEIEHLKLYLEIEKVRFGHRLVIDIKESDDSLNCVLPSLLLQPVVENAIKFGLYDSTGEVTITIHSKKEGGHLVVEVTNPFDVQTQSANKGTGFGLNSLQRRLYLLYARNDLLTTQKTENIFITTLKIPV